MNAQAVYEALTDKAKARTSKENVEDVLEAFLRVPKDRILASDRELTSLFLDNSLKPEEIGGSMFVRERRVGELLWWFFRFAKGQANPKWFKCHAYELAYYATGARVRILDISRMLAESWLEVRRLRALVEEAWREGHNTGLGDGHPLADKPQKWEDSGAYEDLAKLGGGV